MIDERRAKVKADFNNAIKVLGEQRVSHLLKRIEFEVGPHGYGSTSDVQPPRVDFNDEVERQLLQSYVDFITANRRIVYKQTQNKILDDNPFG